MLCFYWSTLGFHALRQHSRSYITGLDVQGIFRLREEVAVLLWLLLPALPAKELAAVEMDLPQGVQVVAQVAPF
jgi:hypothetical protein